MPDVSGGNEQFYQQQFNNLLRDEQDFRTRQRAAQLRAYDADQAKQAAIEGGTYNPNFDDMWASMGVYPSQASSGLNPGEGGQSGPSWELNPNFNFTTDTSNADVFRTLIGQPGFSEYQDKASDWLEAHPEWDTAYNWARTGDPNTLISQLGNQGPLAGSNYDMFQQVFNNLYSQVGTGSSAPPGYVNPTAGVV
jgi:hypothetical protein